jgi:hypothetical protein
MKRDWMLMAIGLLALTAMVCNFSPGGGLIPRKEIPVEQRMAALNDLAVFRDSLPKENPDVDKHTLADHILSLSEFEDAGVSENGSVWGRFTDGRMVVIFYPAGTSDVIPDAAAELASASQSNPEAHPPLSSLPARTASQPKTNGLLKLAPQSVMANSSTYSTQGVEIPESSAAVVTTSFSEQGEKDTVYDLAVWLEDKGYDVRTPEASVEELMKTVKNTGVFYFSTHGYIDHECRF